MSRLTRRDLIRAGLGSFGLRAVPAGVLVGCDAGGPTETDDVTTPELPEVPLTKQPWLQLMAPGEARLRWEVAGADTRVLQVTLVGPDGTETIPVSQQVDEVAFYRPTADFSDNPPDLAGTYQLQEATLTGLAPGEVYGWSLDVGGGVKVEGTFLAPPAKGAPFRFGWLADTMYPTHRETMAMLAALGPDLVLHGGDLQYESNPLDTWSGLFAALAPLTRRAPLQVAVGNHEFEGTEFTEMFLRLIAGAGDSGGETWHAFTYGGVRFLFLDSETASLAETDSPRHAWLLAELEAASADPDVRYPVLVFHRPVFTFSKHYTQSTAVEDVIVPLCRQYGVPLVLSGHAHTFEHFDLGDVHFVVDGTGGSLSYDPDQQRSLVERQRPELLDLRVHVERKYGGLIVEVAADGALTVRRHNLDDGESYVFSIPAPPAG